MQRNREHSEAELFRALEKLRRRIIDYVLWIVEGVDVQIEFDPVFVTHSSTDYADLRGLNLETRNPGKFRLLSFASVSCFPAFLIKFAGRARVVEWQTRTFEGRMPKGMRVQVPPRALNRRVISVSPATAICQPCLAC